MSDTTPQTTESDQRVTVVGIKSKTEKTYTVTLADCGPRDWPYSSTRTYRPRRLVVVKRGGNTASVELGGPMVKKDGGDGTQWATERFYAYQKWPSWLASIVGGLA